MSHSTKFNRPKKDASWGEPILTPYPQVVPSKSRSPAFNSGVDRISQFQLFRYVPLLGQRMVQLHACSTYFRMGVPLDVIPLVACNPPWLTDIMLLKWQIAHGLPKTNKPRPIEPPSTGFHRTTER